MQFLQPLFEFSSACAGCGETPYLKLLSQLFGDRLQIANATGCSSIYGGNLPTTPWTSGPDGRGPAWANSLFEDNAEFGLGYRMAIDKQTAIATGLARKLAPQLGEDLVQAILAAPQVTESDFRVQRDRVAALRRNSQPLATLTPRICWRCRFLHRSVWIVGATVGPTISAGGLDHVLASGRNVSVPCSTPRCIQYRQPDLQATPLGASAKLAAAGRKYRARTSRRWRSPMAMSMSRAGGHGRQQRAKRS
jgi:pyruvate-ferredoxin/flavodoxin oxidoreductase